MDKIERSPSASIGCDTHLPELCTNLVTALASLNVNNLSHLSKNKVLSSSSESNCGKL
jgi:hypothetical protein